MTASPPAVLELDAPAFDPLALHRSSPRRYPFLLQSLLEPSGRGSGERWDILFTEIGESLTLAADGRVEGAARGEGFLAALDAWYERERTPRHTRAALPFQGGWFLYLGYELAAEIEPTLVLPRDPRLPVARAVRCRAAVLRERNSGKVSVVAEGGREVAERIAADVVRTGAPAPISAAVRSTVVEDRAERYLEAVRQARRYIREGDVFQANLSRGWRGALPAGTDAAELYARLCAANPAPFAGLATFPEFSVVSSSPERLVEVRGRRAQTRPIAGTRRRDADPARDRALLEELLANPKERAEHVMLIDLERNDLSRVCLPGTVEVTEMMTVESYATVHHIVSNVVGELAPEATPGSVVRAVFPGGTITGCPKVRCMEIIAELEGVARGAYTGSMGYLGRDGDLDLNILIRTSVIVADEIELRAGAGIVDESDPTRELEETRHKARGLLRAIAGAAS